MISLETIEELIQQNFRNVLTLLEVLCGRVIEQGIVLNELKNVLTCQNDFEAETNSVNPVDFLEQNSDNENTLEKQSKSMDTNNNCNENIDNSLGITCHDCMQVFKRGTGEFTRHLHMTPCKPYKCDDCSKLFKKKSNMITHKLTHSMEVLQCDQCSSVFKCRKYLTNHRNRKHKVKEAKILVNGDQEIKLEDVCVEEPVPKKRRIDCRADIRSSYP